VRERLSAAYLCKDRMNAQIVAGETLSYRVTPTAYPASAGWSARLILNRRAGGAVLTVNSTADGDDHLITATAATTGGWSPGQYAFEVWVLKSPEQYRLESGQIQVLPGLIATTDGGVDTRSDAERALAAIDAVLLGKATSGMLSYQIGNRQLSSYSMQDLLKLQAVYRRDVAAERAAARIAAGLGGRQRFVVRM
jgi:hypothetical protein